MKGSISISRTGFIYSNKQANNNNFVFVKPPVQVKDYELIPNHPSARIPVCGYYRVSQKTGPTLFFSIYQLLHHLGIKWSALGKNWVLAHLENVQKHTDRLRDAWDIQQGSIRVSFKSEHFVLINVFVKNLKETFHTLCEVHTKNKTYKETNRKYQIKQE